MGLTTLRRAAGLWCAFLVLPLAHRSLSAQSIQSGTVFGVVKDPAGAVVPDAKVNLHNAVTGYDKSTVTDSTGAYRFNNIPQNNYRLTAEAPGFTSTSQTIDVRSSLPMSVDITLDLGAASTTVNVTTSGAVVETDPSTHQDVDRSAFLKLPVADPGAQLSQAITASSGGVAADANGFFHPLGDHAQVSYMIDGQPISDQQNKVFSTQIPANALQSMELITGSPSAEFGDKSSLIVNATVRSGLGVETVRQRRYVLGLFWHVVGQHRVRHGNRQVRELLRGERG